MLARNDEKKGLDGIECRAMKPFRPNRKQTLKSYYEVPVEILESNRELIRWATQSAAILSKRT